jgi:serine/threonine protein kinase
MGLHHIHHRKIIHRDIKALNLFLDAQQNVKVCAGDFLASVSVTHVRHSCVTTSVAVRDVVGCGRAVLKLACCALTRRLVTWALHVR